MKRRRKRKSTPPVIRFFRHVRFLDDGCWEWTGCRHRDGHGKFGTGDRRTAYAHRWAYQQRYGAIPKGKVLDHFVCDRPWCANPDHVRPVTNRENILRGKGASARAASVTVCPKGHVYDEANTYERNGHRRCRTCNTEAARDYRRRRKAAA